MRFLLLLLIFLISPAYAQRNLSGTPEIELALKNLNVLGSVLMIAAHPDDENTALLAYYARGRNMRTAYLSATRGEGGQNLIGSEQGDVLGVIRTQELLAARQIDGAGQFFTRAIDFGFTKSAEETLSKWGREKILGDMVWVIRRFRPDVVVLRFSGTPRDGHGQHQTSAILGKEAFQAAADRNRFPDQLTSVEAWQPKRLLFNVFTFSPEQEKAAAGNPARLEIDTGEYNPVLGKSYSEIAGISRSMHHSQGMGAPERKGPAKSYLLPIAGEPAGKDAFNGIDTTWNRLPAGAEVGRLLSEALRTFSPQQPEKSIPLLLKARPLMARIKDPWAAVKLAELDEAVGLCAGLWLDAAADRYAAIPGGKLQVKVSALNRSHFPLSLVSVNLEGVPAASQSAGPAVASLAYNIPISHNINLQLPADQPYSQPFWLAKPKDGSTYTIDQRELIGLADAPPVLSARFRINAGSSEIELTRPVRYRYVDHVQGELTRPLTVVPAVAVVLPENVLLFPNASPRTVQVQLKANVPKAAGELRLELQNGWRSEPESRPFQLSDVGQQEELAFEITPPPGEKIAMLRAVAVVEGRQIASGMQVIAHSHIPPQTLFPPAEAKLVRAGVKILAKHVGYVMGAGDEMPQALRQLGCEVILLGPEDLSRRNLSEFDAIVTGVRAYNVRADLRANQQRLLEYVRNGGTMIVQYNVAEGGPFGAPETGALSRLGPYPLRIGRERVTVEEAPVTFPHPGHPVLESPNVITPGDFEGWVQERGLYFASQWDPHYQSLLESHDPGENPLPGGMLYTRFGKGVYIFSAYAWFRQLPAGVPGAYRLFANMLSAGKLR